jgi:hypothetical protein
MDGSTKRATGFDSFTLRELKYRGEGQGRAFRTPDGRRYEVRLATIDGAPHVVRVSIGQVDRNGRGIADLGPQDVHFAPEQDLEALILKNVRMRLLDAPAALDAKETAAAIVEGWGRADPKPARKGKAK